MYNDVLLNSNVNSYYHRLNPWVKILCFIIFSIIVIIQKDTVFLGIINILLINLILMSNVKISSFLKVLYKIKFLLLLIFLFNYLLNISLLVNLTIMLKILLIVFYYSLVLFTTNFDSVNYGFNKLLTPFRFLGKIVNNIALFITSIFMFIPNLLITKKEYMESLSLRGLDFKSSNIANKIKIIRLVIKNAFKYTFIHSNNKKIALNIRLNNNINSIRKSFSMDDAFILFTHIFVIAVVIIKGVIL